MKILKYYPKKQTAEIEWQGSIHTISDEAALKMRIDIFKDIPENALPELLAESEKVLCRQYLYSQLDRYFKTKQGYYQKLLEKGFSKTSARSALDDAEKNGFINDRYYAERYIEQNCAKKGRYKLKQELKSKGVSSEIIDEALENLPPQNEELLTLAQKLSKGKCDSPEEKARLYRKLASRGFGFDEINSVIKQIFSEDID